MPLHRVKLVGDAFEKAQAHDTGVSLFESKERYDQRVSEDDGWVTLRPREFDRLRTYGLIDEAELDAPGLKNPEDEDPNTREISQVDRFRTFSNPTPVGGVGHQPGDAYGNDAVQREYQRDLEQGLAQSKGNLFGNKEVEEASKRADGHLPEQVKEHERQVKERDKDVEQSRKESAKEHERRAKEQEKATEKAEKDAERERKERAKDTQEVVPDSEVGPRQGQGGPQDRTEKETGAVRDGGEPETDPKAHDKAKSRTQRNDKVKDALKTDDKNDDKQGS